MHTKPKQITLNITLFMQITNFLTFRLNLVRNEKNCSTKKNYNPPTFNDIFNFQ